MSDIDGNLVCILSMFLRPHKNKVNWIDQFCLIALSSFRLPTFPCFEKGRWKLKAMYMRTINAGLDVLREPQYNVSTSYHEEVKDYWKAVRFDPG